MRKFFKEEHCMGGAHMIRAKVGNSHILLKLAMHPKINTVSIHVPEPLSFPSYQQGSWKIQTNTLYCRTARMGCSRLSIFMQICPFYLFYWNLRGRLYGWKVSYCSALHSRALAHYTPSDCLQTICFITHHYEEELRVTVYYDWKSLPLNISWPMWMELVICSLVPSRQVSTSQHKNCFHNWH